MKNTRCLISGQKKTNISVVVFFWKYDVKTRCKNFNLLPLFEKNNGMVINKKTFCSQESRIALKTHLSPSLLSMADKRSIQGGKSVSIYLDALFGKIILRIIKTRQKTDISFVCLCILIATQDNLPTRKVISAGAQTFTDSKRHSIPCNNQKKYILLSKWCGNSWRLFTERHFLAENVILNMSAIPTNTILNVHVTPSRA